MIIEELLAMLDSDNPADAGALLGEYLAAAVERSPRYPRLKSDQDLLVALDKLVLQRFIMMRHSLLDIGFSTSDVQTYQDAGLRAFHNALPMVAEAVNSREIPQ